jgi:hypothetical protein
MGQHVGVPLRKMLPIQRRAGLGMAWWKPVSAAVDNCPKSRPVGARSLRLVDEASDDVKPSIHSVATLVDQCKEIVGIVVRTKDAAIEANDWSCWIKSAATYRAIAYDDGGDCGQVKGRKAPKSILDVSPLGAERRCTDGAWLVDASDQDVCAAVSECEVHVVAVGLPRASISATECLPVASANDPA